MVLWIWISIYRMRRSKFVRGAFAFACGANYELPESGAHNFACGAIATFYLAARRFNFSCGANYPYQALKGDWT